MTYCNMEKIRVWTFFDGTDEDVADFGREWETLLNTEFFCEENGEGQYFCEVYVTQAQIDEFNMDEDWFTIQ
jgi:hypothetical protein